MAIKTLEEQLESVQVAIEQAERRRSYTIKDRSMESSDIQYLYDREQWLLERIARRDARAQRGGIRSVRFTA